MLAILLLFVFATVGVKLLLGLVFIYYLLPVPEDRRCPACDGETVSLQPRPGFRLLSRLCRVQRRLCLRCGRTELAQRGREDRMFVGHASEEEVRQPGR